MGVTEALDKIKMAHLHTWYTPWKISENFWESHTHRNAAYTQGGRTGGGDGGYGASTQILTNFEMEKPYSQVILPCTEEAQKLQPFDIVNATRNAYLCRRKMTETAVREYNPSNQHGISCLTRCPPVRLQKSK